KAFNVAMLSVISTYLKSIEFCERNSFTGPQLGQSLLPNRVILFKIIAPFLIVLLNGAILYIFHCTRTIFGRRSFHSGS
ncbi:MAG: hypothetical protein Q8N36_05670, partial [bacterium]|nr:hypothetical protein [bacterium]